MMAILPKLIYRFQATPIKISVVFFAEIRKLIIKFKWKCKGSRIAKIILKNKIGRLTLLDFKTHDSNQKVRYWYKDAQINEIEVRTQK